MNEPSRRGPIARAIVGIWDAMNFTRRLVFNLVFFALLILFLMFAFSRRLARAVERPHHARDRTRRPPGRAVQQRRRQPRAVEGDGRWRHRGSAVARPAARARCGREGQAHRTRLRALRSPAAHRLRVVARTRRGAGEGARVGQAGRRIRRKLRCRSSTCSPRRPTRCTWIRWAAWCSKASTVIASTTAKACRTSSASTCICSRSANTNRPPSPTCSTPRRRRRRKPTCSG